MDGKAVFRFAVDALPRCLHAVLEETGKTLDELDWVVCHQANSRIIDHCVRALKADPAKFYKNMERHGNTSAASIPVALNELAESGQLKPGQLLACIGFGGGLTWGGMIVEYDPFGGWRRPFQRGGFGGGGGAAFFSEVKLREKK